MRRKVELIFNQFPKHSLSSPNQSNHAPLCFIVHARTWLLTWLTASSAFRLNSAIFSSVWRLISLIIVDSWCVWDVVDVLSAPRCCCRIDIARFVLSTMPLMHDNIVWIFRHSSSPLPLPDDAVPLTWPLPVAPPRFARDGVSVFTDLISRSSPPPPPRLLLCCVCWKCHF